MKMMRIGLLTTIAVVSLAIGISSCARPPELQARQARSALGDLRDVAKAPLWAADEFAAAEAAVKAADRELSAQKGRAFLTRDYDKAEQMYVMAMQDITRARQAAQDGKQTAEKQAREALDAALSAIGHAQAAITIAPVRGSDDLLDRELDRAATRLNDVRNMIAAEKYGEAAQRAEEILEQVTSLLRSVRSGARR